MKIIKAIHVTQTEKVHIKQMLNLKVKEAHTKIKHYKIIAQKNNQYTIEIYTKATYGRKFHEKQTVIIEK